MDSNRVGWLLFVILLALLVAAALGHQRQISPADVLRTWSGFCLSW